MAMHDMMSTIMGYNPHNMKAPQFIIDYIDYLMREMKKDAIEGEFENFEKHMKLVYSVLNEVTVSNETVSDEWIDDLYEMLRDHVYNTLGGNEEAIEAWLGIKYSSHFNF